MSADTTEADLKQRRELLPQGVGFTDGPVVSAALRGGLLLLDGLERAERNVLPTLNNLLENREMALEDGRFLVASRRYEALKEPTERLAKVHEDFRVLALASPCPPFEGRALDPPLRSRFQALLIPPAPTEELTEVLMAASEEKVARPLLAAVETLVAARSQAVFNGFSTGFDYCVQSENGF